MDTVVELMEYLDMRGAKYGIDGAELLEQIPESVRQPKQAYEFMQLKDISHKVPLSEGGAAAGDNWFLEDSSVNRSRGAETVTPEEEAAAKADSLIDAKQLTKAAFIGGALTTGGAIAEGALVAGEAAVAATELAVVIPTALTIAAVGGVGYILYRIFK